MLVQLDRVMKKYGSFALELNMEIPENQVTGLIGANGAGKSTTFKLMLGLIRPDEGNVEIFGRNAAEMGAEDKQKIGAAFSDSGFSEYLKVQQLIPIMSRFYPDFQEEEFRGRCERFKIPLNKQIKEFSTGMKAKLNVLLALSHDSRLLILDEPTAGLDPRGRDEILAQIRAYHETKQATVILVSHSMEEIARNVGRIVVMRDAHVYMDGTPRQVFARAEELEQAGLDVPQVTKIAMALRRRGMDIDPAVYTIEELEQALLNRRGGGEKC